MLYTSCNTIDEKAQPYVVYLVCFTFYSGKKTWVKVFTVYWDCCSFNMFNRCV